MKITFVTSEAIPYAKTGGLADVAGTLPKYLKKLGVEVSSLLPLYKIIKDKKIPLLKISSSTLTLGDKKFVYSIYKNNDGAEFDTYFVENDKLFFRDELYNQNGVDFSDNYLRYAFFCLASLKFIIDSGGVDIIHAHDWQASLIPVYKTLFFPERREKVLLTIHNLSYQGIFPREVLKEIDLPESLFHIEGLEFYGKVNFLKGGIIFSDFLSTVSSSYSKEIQTTEFGFGLHDLLLKRKDYLTGIINGIDYSYWNPETDPYIPFPFSLKNVNKKRENQKFLFQKLGISFDWKKPLFAMVSRITSQKGFDLLLDIFPELMNLPLNFIILGTGEWEYENRLKDYAKIYQDKFIPVIKFDEELSHQIYAASDFFIIPSKFEPCGLTQLIALRYGSIPIVRRTGGLRDTIQDYHEKTNCGNGLSFDNYNSFELLEVIKKALKIFAHQPIYQQIQKLGIKCDYSWTSSSQEYIRLYNLIKEK